MDENVYPKHVLHTSIFPSMNFKIRRFYELGFLWAGLYIITKNSVYNKENGIATHVEDRLDVHREKYGRSYQNAKSWSREVLLKVVNSARKPFNFNKHLNHNCFMTPSQLATVPISNLIQIVHIENNLDSFWINF